MTITAAVPQSVRRSSSRPFVMSSEVETSLLLKSRDLVRSLPIRSTSGLPVYVAASPAAPFSTPLGMTMQYDSIAPEHRAHGRAIGAGKFQRQRGKVVNTGTD